VDRVSANADAWNDDDALGGKLRKVIILAVLVRLPVFADGGAVHLRGETEGLAVTLFAAPVPLSTGPADLSVLLQKRDSLEPVLDAEVSIAMRSVASGSELRAQATREHAQNKFLYAAPLTLGESGKWQIQVTILRLGVKSEIAGIVDVSPNQQKLTSYWGYVTLPPLTVLLFAVREQLLLRRSRRSKEALCKST